MKKRKRRRRLDLAYGPTAFTPSLSPKLLTGQPESPLITKPVIVLTLLGTFELAVCTFIVFPRIEIPDVGVESIDERQKSLFAVPPTSVPVCACQPFGFLIRVPSYDWMNGREKAFPCCRISPSKSHYCV